LHRIHGVIRIRPPTLLWMTLLGKLTVHQLVHIYEARRFTMDPPPDTIPTSSPLLSFPSVCFAFSFLLFYHRNSLGAILYYPDSDLCWDDVSELRPPTGLLFNLQMTWVWRCTVELCWQGTDEEFGEKPVPVPPCPSKIHTDWPRLSRLQAGNLPPEPWHGLDSDLIFDVVTYFSWCLLLYNVS
jgi:hypothetical protein